MFMPAEKLGNTWNVVYTCHDAWPRRPNSLALGEDSILGAPCQSKHGICAKEQPQGQHETTELIGGVNPFIKLPGMIIPNDQYFSMGLKLDHATIEKNHHTTPT